MLKQTVQYKDFDDVNKTKNLYFNLTRVEVINNLELKNEFEDVQEMIGAATRDLEIHEVKLILELVKKLMRLSYGVQKEVDGEIVFSKRPEVWEVFQETAVYDEFLMNLFQEPEKAVAFLVGIWPDEIKGNVDVDQLKLPGMPVKSAADIPQKDVVVQLPDGSTASEYTREALLAMPKAEFDVIVGTDPAKMSQEHLQIAFIRKSSGE